MYLIMFNNSINEKSEYYLSRYLQNIILTALAKNINHKYIIYVHHAINSNYD